MLTCFGGDLCRLVLSDGSVWHGVAFGATGTALGEVVFNTSMSGYQVLIASLGIPAPISVK